MSQWNDKLNNHPVFSQWESLGNLIHREWSEALLEPNIFESIARMKKVYAYVGDILDKADPELTPQSSLSGMQGAVTKCIAELNAFIGNNNEGHLNNANSHIDTILVASQQMPSSIHSLSKSSIEKSVKHYSDAIDDFVIRLKNQYELGVQDLQEETRNVKSSLEVEQGLVTEIKAELKNIQQVIQKQTSEFNNQFQRSETDRTNKYEKEIESYDGKFSTLYESNKNTSDAQFNNLTLRIGKIIEVLTRLQDDASKVYGVTINTLQAGAYSSYANEERKIANRFRWLAGGLMLIGVGLLVTPEIKGLLGNGEYIFEWMKVLGRVPLSLVVFVPAFYFARESGKHRSNEVLNRRRQHILSTLDPYIELMDKASADALKADVAKSIFADTASASKTEDSDLSNLISQIANLIKQARSDK
jgi:hypothetical protein